MQPSRDSEQRVGLPRPLRWLIVIVVTVSVPEGLALLFGPPAWYASIWGWNLTPLSARFISGVYLSVALGFVLVWRSGDRESARIPLAMLWSFALVALLGTFATVALGQGMVSLNRPFAWVWIFLYVVSVIGGAYYHLASPSTPDPNAPRGS